MILCRVTLEGASIKNLERLALSLKILPHKTTDDQFRWKMMLIRAILEEIEPISFRMY